MIFTHGYTLNGCGFGTLDKKITAQSGQGTDIMLRASRLKHGVDQSNNDNNSFIYM
jgi:hypothetical protein